MRVSYVRERRLRLGLLCALLTLMTGAAWAAFLHDVPVEVTQPDGAILHLLASGDEHFSWVHDERGFVVVRRADNGLVVYADKVGGRLEPTRLVVGRDDPAAAGLQPGLMPERRFMPALPKAQRPLATAPEREAEAAPKFSYINNLVVFIRFAGEAEYSVLRPARYYDEMFNAADVGANSMFRYFFEASYSQLRVTSTFYPTPVGGYVVSYQDSHNRSYFKPYDAASNPDGYQNESESNEREQQLLADAIQAIAGQVPADLVIDTNGDGRVDNVCFIVSGQPGAWSSLLWPHRTALYLRVATIAGKRVWDYNLQLESTTGNSVLCHEMTHSLGAPDLYHYTRDGITPVGSWDLMETNRNPPQHMGAYMKSRYLGFLGSIPEITKSGTYTLNPLTSAVGNSYRIASPNAADEYYVVEYRRQTGIFESSLPGTGLLVYRINQTLIGNADGPPDNVYLFRPGGTPFINGTPNTACLSAESGRTAIDSTTNPYPFTTVGGPGGLEIRDVGAAGETISFTVNLENPCRLGEFLLDGPESPVFGSQVTLRWQALAAASSYDVYLGPYEDPTLLGNQTETSRTVAIPGDGLYYWKVAARTSCGAAPSSSGVWKLYVNPTIGVLRPGVPVPGASQPSKGGWLFFSIEVPVGARNLKFSTSGTVGDLDLFARPLHFPNERTYVCKSTGPTSTESCTVAAPQLGVWYLGLQAYEAFTDVTVSATYAVGNPVRRRVHS